MAALLGALLITGSVVATAREARGSDQAERVTCTVPVTLASGADRHLSAARAAAAVSPAIVSLEAASNTETEAGSGIVIRSDGLILTNNHLVAAVAVNGGRITITLPAGRTARAEVVGREPKNDIAVIQAVGISDVPVAPLGNSRSLRVGDHVLTIGNALGQSGTVSAGIVSALRRTACVTSPAQATSTDQIFGAQPSLPHKTRFQHLIQTDAHINPGNSGGALVDYTGRVVGVTTLALTADNTTGSVGIGFAIPIEDAYAMAERLIGATDR